MNVECTKMCKMSEKHSEIICRKPRDTKLQRIPSYVLHAMAKCYLDQPTVSVVRARVWF